MISSKSVLFAATKDDDDTTNRKEIRYYPNHELIDGVLYFPGTTRQYLQDIKNLPVKGDEVFVATYLRVGTTWTSEIVWQIFCNGSVDSSPIYHRVPFVDGLRTLSNITTTKQLFDFFSEKPFPRVFKTHLQYPLVPMGDGATTRPKYINVIRNPKDCAVSFYHFEKIFRWTNFNGPWEEFFEMFIKGEVEFGSWFDHVLGWWAHRDDPNILTIKYEDMKKDLPSAVQQVAQFLGKDLSEDMIQLIAKQTSFEAMSKGDGRFYDGDKTLEGAKVQDATNWIRKGEVGGWQNYFTEEQNRRFDELYEKKMAGSGLDFDFS